MKKNKNNRKKVYLEKYNFGSFVTKNQQSIAGAGNIAAGFIPDLLGDNNISGGLSGALSLGATGAALGPAGLVGGAVLGGLSGIFGSRKRRKAREKLIRDNSIAELGQFEDYYSQDIDTNNENPYGIFAEGGDIHINPKNKGKFTKSAKSAGMGVQEFARHVLANKDNYSSTQVKRANFARNAAKWKHEDGGDVGLEKINIELGELQIDPETGKILREYTGINPETGGKYEPHAKGNKKDTKNNIVSAEEGTFIITKSKAKEYKDSIDNNDKLRQNAILHNIRNNKRSAERKKFQFGGDIRKDFSNIPNALMNPLNPTMSDLGVKTLPNYNNILDNTTGVIDQSTTPKTDILGNIIDYGVGIGNIIQGNKSPNYVNRVRSVANPYRSQALSNLPNEINMTPLLNRISNERRVAFDTIDQTTSSSAIARANKANVAANTQSGIQDAYFQGEGINNQIRAQRASLLNQFGEQDVANKMNVNRTNLEIDNINRQMDLAKQQQRNYGLSQLQQMFQTKRTNKQLSNNEQLRIKMLDYMFPALSPYINDLLTGGINA